MNRLSPQCAKEGSANPGFQIAAASKFCTLTPQYGNYSVPRSWRLRFWGGF